MGVLSELWIIRTNNKEGYLTLLAITGGNTDFSNC